MDRDGSSSQLLQLPTQKHRRPSLVTLLEQLIADVTTSSCANNDNDDDVNNDDDNDGDDDDASVDDVDDGDDTRSDQDDDDAILTNNTRRQQQRLAVIETILRKDYLPIQQRTTIDELVEDFDTKLQKDVHEMITDQDGANYQGLDSNYNTDDEVETILRIFPDLINKRKETKFDIFDNVWDEIDDDDDEDGGNYPIQCLTIMRDENGIAISNLMATPFVHLFAQLAIEFHSFDADTRGGLMIQDKSGNNSIHNLAHSNYPFTVSNEDNHNMDIIRTTEFCRLRRMGLMFDHDITGINLLLLICQHHIFPENSARFLIEWCPVCLLPSGRYNSPLYTIAMEYRQSDLHGGFKYLPAFQFLFEQCIRYYPYKKGISLLFQDIHQWGTDEHITPFAEACSITYRPLKCNSVKRNAIMDVVEDVLARYSGTTPINTMEAILAAAMDPEIHVDGVYFLTRRQPDVLISRMKFSNTNSSSINNNPSTHGQDTKNNNNDISSDGDNGNTIKNGHETNNDDDLNDSKPITADIGKRKRNNY